MSVLRVTIRIPRLRGLWLWHHVNVYLCKGEVATTEGKESSRTAGVSRLWRGLTILAAAAAVVLALVASKYSQALQDQEIHDSAERAALSDRITRLEHDFLGASSEAAALRQQAQLDDRITRTALAPDSTIIRLAALRSDPGARGVIAVSAAGHEAVMRVAGLPPAAAGKTYELWWIGSRGKPARAALFRPDALGAAIVVAALPSGGQRPIAAIVTLESTPGSGEPTGATYLKGAAGGH